ncbi:tRNA pseudouridine(55) synthase TruB [Nocardioides sp. ChNu-153]|uniref:tRNA pseudouridine(55) synthase TruB n=1 Tax=unclassified Nocardioides TaxID=2615069 RepID=UPI002405C804|nr:MULTISPECIES: tRNA pseudouridine(55) synthase TruB [unclassified Nocardioides]MDF9715970.1 tRNA pseudouridine(55) synthase TruB [Nocardioides sp. ChNu-99]MDN7122963.1 tRNA pseudouridine(55) synthase TruB [Nocardioides sp. ChNu-153]
MSEAPTGIVVVDKPGGITSHGVVGRVRRLAGTRKVGHAGTLDPMATGVLVLGVGRATRLLGHLMLTEKGYAATVRLGVATSTDDAEGEVLAVRPAGHVTEADVRTALAGFVGEIDQVPTAVSAIKVDGKRAYQRVRDGEDVVLASRRVTVHELVVDAVRPAEVDGTPVLDVDVELRCSSGTYVRAIARDLGALLGTGGHLTALRRTAVGPFDLSAARTLEQLDDAFAPVPLAEVARRVFPVLEVDADGERDVRVGRSLDRPAALPGHAAVDLAEEGAAAPPLAVLGPDGDFLALYRAAGERLKPVAVFV